MDKNTQGNVPVSNYKTARLDVYRDTRRCSTKQANFRKREKNLIPNISIINISLPVMEYGYNIYRHLRLC